MQGCIKIFGVLIAIGLIANYWPVALAFFAIYIVYRYIRERRAITNYREPPADYSVNYDSLDGIQFEHFCADILKRNGFDDVNVTQGSGDYGVDILARKNKLKYAIQCKCYSSNVGNKAVQEAFSGKAYYNADIAAVMTNMYFTPHAIETATKTGVMLWDRTKLDKMLENSGLSETRFNGICAEDFEEDEEWYSDPDRHAARASLNAENHSRKVVKEANALIPKKEKVIMFDREKGIYPPGGYVAGDDIQLGKYILTSQGDASGSISTYDSYAKYKKDDIKTFKSFKGDYFLSLREAGEFVEVENADIQRVE